MQGGKIYKLEVVSWSPKHKAETIDRELFFQGCRFGLSLVRSDENALAEAERQAKGADTVVVIVGTGPEWESEGFDRVGMDLPRRQSDLIARVAEACPGRTIVIVNTRSPIDTSHWIDSVDPVIQAWFPA